MVKVRSQFRVLLSRSAGRYVECRWIGFLILRFICCGQTKTGQGVQVPANISSVEIVETELEGSGQTMVVVVMMMAIERHATPRIITFFPRSAGEGN